MKWFIQLRGRQRLLPWMLSYLLMLAIPLVTYGMTIVFTTHTMEKEIQENNAVMIGQVAQAYDSTLKGALQFRDYMWQDQELSLLLPLHFPLDAQTRYDIWQASTNFYRQMWQNPSIGDGYIYLHQTQTALCHGSIYNHTVLWDEVHKNDTILPEAWFSLLERYHLSDFTLIPSADGHYRVALLSSLPMSNFYSTAATIVIILDENAFLAEDVSNGDTELLVLGADGELIAATNAEIDLALLNANIAARAIPMQGFEMEMDGKRYMVNAVTSQYADWSYVSITPMSTLEQKLIRVSGWMVISAMVSAFAGLMLAFRLARSNRATVDGLLQKLYQLPREMVDEPGQGGFEQINKMLDGIIRHSDRMDIVVEKQRALLQRHALERLLFSGGHSDRILQEIGIEFHHPSFVTAVCFFNENLDTNMDDESAERLLMDNATRLSVQWRAFGDIHLLAHRGKVVLLMNVPTGTLTPALQESMTRQIHLLQQEHLEQHRYFFVSISSEHEGINCICDAYYEAIGWVNYSLIDRPREFSVYFCPVRQAGSAPLALTAVQEEMMFSVLSSGNEQAVRDLVDQLCQPFRHAPVSPVMVRCYFHSIVSAMARDLPATSLPDVVENELVFMENSTDIREMQESLLKLALRLCGSQEQNEKGGGLLEEMIGLMREHYTDCNFNISTLADMVNRSLSYISKYFKDKTGVGLYDYLNRMRIEKAKELISSSNRPISTLIGLAGFQNLGSFIRVFKRYENMTPGAYQKSQRKE